MPRNTDGTYNLPTGTLVNTGDLIQPSQHNPAMQDIAASLTNSLDRQGRGQMLASLDMGGNAIRNAANGSDPTDALTVQQAAGFGVPVGTILDFGGTVLPDGYLWCNGALVSRTDYAELFGVIGGVFGNGDGSTTFATPDFRGRVAAGKDDMGGAERANRITEGGSGLIGRNLGAGGGSQIHVLTTAQMPLHNHTGSVSDAGAHTHSILGRAGSDTAGPYVAGASTSADLKATESAGVHSHTLT